MLKTKEIECSTGILDIIFLVLVIAMTNRNVLSPKPLRTTRSKTAALEKALEKENQITFGLVSKKATPEKIAKVATSVGMRKTGRVKVQMLGVPIGAGGLSDPIRILNRDVPNASNCIHCPIGVEECDCAEMQDIIWAHLEKVNMTRVSGHKDLNAKSILPPFVARLIRLLGITRKDCFWDLGCGNGSVVMQVACQTGATAVGVEIQAANIDIANAVWPSVKAEWERRHPTRKAGAVHFVACDMFPVLTGSVDGTNGIPMPTTAWAANLLFPPMLNHTLSEALLEQPALRAVASLKDIYPHHSTVYKKRNPRPFEKFPVMLGHEWQEGAVEWSPTEVQNFYTYANKK